MPVESIDMLKISCDNPTCPGHPDLNPSKRDGWLFVSHEIYGDPTQQHVFGNADCVSQATGDPAVAADLDFVKLSEPEPIEPALEEPVA